VNNDRSAIDLLFQVKPGAAPEKPRAYRTNRWEPVLEDARFRKSSVTTGVNVYDLATGDFNGDGRIDLAYTGDPQVLTLRYQEKDGTWTEKRIQEAPVPSQMVGSFRAGDVDGDKRTDLVMLGQKELALFFQDKSGDLAAPERYALPDDSCYGLELLDVNGDGRIDIVYLCSNTRDALRVRLQVADRQFGPEQAYAIKPSRCTLQTLQTANAKSPAVFAFAQEATGQFEEFKLATAKAAESGLMLRPRVFSPRPGSKTSSAYALGDINGDGQIDVVVSDPDGAQVFIYLRQRDGGFTRPERYPVFSDARSVATGDWDGDGRADVFVASPKEQSVGVASFTKDGRLSYPQPLPITGRPVAIAVGRLEAKSPLTLAVAREEKGKRTLELWVKKSDSAELAKTVELPGLKADPRAVRFFDLNQDGKMDLLVFATLDTMRIFVQSADGNFSDVTTAPGFRRGLVDNLEPAAVTFGDVDGDQKSELIVSSGNFSRALRLNEKNELTVVDQFNARDSVAEVATTLIIPQGGKGKPAVVLYDRKTDGFQTLRPNEQSLYQVVDTAPAGKIESLGAELIANPKGGPEAFIFGKDRFWWMPLNRGDFAVETVATHATDLPEIHYSDVVVGDLNNDGIAEAVCIDPEKNVIEILGRDVDHGWESRLHFKVFETDEHFQGMKGPPQEPRETYIADVTGDGKKDLILLVHDRVLLYPQD
jgi:FG-GAP-like repeat